VTFGTGINVFFIVVLSTILHYFSVTPTRYDYEITSLQLYVLFHINSVAPPLSDEDSYTPCHTPHGSFGITERTSVWNLLEPNGRSLLNRTFCIFDFERRLFCYKFCNAKRRSLVFLYACRSLYPTILS
jgi:hypothetical protein